MKHTFLSLIVVSLIPFLLQPAHAIEFDCKRMNETTDAYKSYEIIFKIDLMNNIVTENDGCATLTYNNSSDINTNGHDYSKCPRLSRKPELGKFKRDPKAPLTADDLTSRLSMPDYRRHPNNSEVYHVTVTSDGAEWGLKSRGVNLSYTLNTKTNVLIFDTLCLNCIAIRRSTATYQCKKVSR